MKQVTRTDSKFKQTIKTVTTNVGDAFKRFMNGPGMENDFQLAGAGGPNVTVNRTFYKKLPSNVMADLTDNIEFVDTRNFFGLQLADKNPAFRANGVREAITCTEATANVARSLFKHLLVTPEYMFKKVEPHVEPDPRVAEVMLKAYVVSGIEATTANSSLKFDKQEIVDSLRLLNEKMSSYSPSAPEGWSKKHYGSYEKAVDSFKATLAKLTQTIEGLDIQTTKREIDESCRAIIDSERQKLGKTVLEQGKV